MTRILRAVLKAEAIEVYVYSADDTLNARVGKKVAELLGPEAATIFWRLRDLSDGMAVIGHDDELNLIQVAVNDDGLLAVDACASLRESTVTDVVEATMLALECESAGYTIH